MAARTYRGSCHCGKVRFEADIDLSAGTSKCNCTKCWKTRMWSASIGPEAFCALAGEAVLSRGERGGFCQNCGVSPYLRVNTAAWGGPGEQVSVNVACLDDLDPAELVAAPVVFNDGRNDNWWNPPAETRHL